jgi:hypothetical protein
MIATKSLPSTSSLELGSGPFAFERVGIALARSFGFDDLRFYNAQCGKLLEGITTRLVSAACK